MESDKSGLVGQGVVGLEGRGNEQDHQDDDEQKPEQGGNALGAAESDPGASEGEQTIQNEDGLGQAAARTGRCRAGGSPVPGAARDGEDRATSRRPARFANSRQPGGAVQPEIDRRIIIRRGETLSASMVEIGETVENSSRRSD